MKRFVFVVIFAVIALGARSVFAGQSAASRLSDWMETTNDRLIDYYEDTGAAQPLVIPSDLLSTLNPDAQKIAQIKDISAADAQSFPLQVGATRGRLQQAMVLELADAVLDGRVVDAQSWRAQLELPRGVSATEGALILQNLPPGRNERAGAAKTLVREALTWQTARVRQLLSDADHAADHPDVPMPGRLMEELGEAGALADVPPALRQLAGMSATIELDPSVVRTQVATLSKTDWAGIAQPLDVLSHQIETHLPSLLSQQEFARRERLLLKLVTIIPKEYQSGVRDGQVTVALEYREAVSFTEQARQFADELAPIWLGKNEAKFRKPLDDLESHLNAAQETIKAVRSTDELSDELSKAQSLLEGPFDISLRRGGTTADIVDEVMLETRSLLGSSLAAANAGNWSQAESLRLEAYTTYDPDLEARLMPRDPQLATDIEHLLFDGLEKPGVKALLDKRVAGPELEAAYSRVYSSLDRASALLKSGVSPTAAAISAGSIVLREGLEGLLVIVAILAGLRGDENRRKRAMIWLGVALSFVATIITVILSQTVITRLHSYSETIEAVTSILAILVLLLITNWLFQQIYWRQWVCTLKSHAESESAWHLITVGFLIGYREGFETVLFIQSLTLDAGGGPVSIGVLIGLILLIGLGIAALVAGLKLPYFKLLLGTASLIGFVLVTFVGTGVRAMQTVGWLPVHKLVAASWPAWVGKWFGVYDSVETISAQILTIFLVLGTWRFSRWKAKRAAAARAAVAAEARAANCAGSAACELDFKNPNEPCPAERHQAPAAADSGPSIAILSPVVTITVHGIRPGKHHETPEPIEATI